MFYKETAAVAAADNDNDDNSSVLWWDPKGWLYADKLTTVVVFFQQLSFGLHTGKWNVLYGLAAQEFTTYNQHSLCHQSQHGSQTWNSDPFSNLDSIKPASLVPCLCRHPVPRTHPM
jgi:hypothetical protein